MKLKPPYALQIVVADNRTIPDNGNPEIVYDSVEALMAARPDCRAIAFGFRIIDAATGRVPNGLEPWYESPSTAYADYERKLDPRTSSSSRHGDIASLTRRRENIAEIRDELYRVGNLLQSVLDGKLYQTDIAGEIDVSTRHLHHQIANKFSGYIKTKLASIDDLCRALEDVRTPGDKLLLHVFGVDLDDSHEKDKILLLPDYDEDALWDIVNRRLRGSALDMTKMYVGAYYGDIAGGALDGQTLTSREIARLYNITPQRVCQILRKSFRRLRHPAMLHDIFETMDAEFPELVNKKIEQTCERILSEKLKESTKTPGPAEPDKPAEPAELPVISIMDAQFSVRTYNCLYRANIDTLNQLADMTYDQVAKIRNLGQKCIREIEEKLKTTFGRGFLPETE